MPVKSLVAALALIVAAQAATITFTGVVAPYQTGSAEKESITFSPIGTGSGETTYVEQIVATAGGPVTAVIESPSGFTTFTQGVSTVISEVIETSTFISTGTVPAHATTITGTLIVGASNFVFSQVPAPAETDRGGDWVSCNLDGHGGGSCVEKVWPGPTGSTYTTSYTGPATAYYTLTTGNNAASRVHVTGAVVLGLTTVYATTIATIFVFLY